MKLKWIFTFAFFFTITINVFAVDSGVTKNKKTINLNCKKYLSCNKDKPCSKKQESCLIIDECKESICISEDEACKAVCGSRICSIMDSSPSAISCMSNH